MMKGKIVHPKALVCGMLEDNGRVLFLNRKDKQGMLQIELPCTDLFPGEDPIQKLTSEFLRQTGIDGEVKGILMEKRYNSGSRRKKIWIPCLIFSVRSKDMHAHPSSEFSGFQWLSLEEAKSKKLSRKSEHLRY